MKKIVRRSACSICILLAVMVLTGCGRTSYLQEAESVTDSSSSYRVSSSTAEKDVVTDATVDHTSASTSDNREASDHKADIYVQMAGAVKNPGIYQLPADSRVFEAVEMAGGLTEDADAASFNQAVPLQDGQMIYVCRVGETPPEGTFAADTQPAVSSADQKETADSGRVNINTADAGELMTLPGIGETRAEAVITYRKKNGSFASCEDIMKVSGIKQGAYAKIKDLICVR